MLILHQMKQQESCNVRVTNCQGGARHEHLFGMAQAVNKNEWNSTRCSQAGTRSHRLSKFTLTVRRVAEIWLPMHVVLQHLQWNMIYCIVRISCMCHAACCLIDSVQNRKLRKEMKQNKVSEK